MQPQALTRVNRSGMTVLATELGEEESARFGPFHHGKQIYPRSFQKRIAMFPMLRSMQTPTQVTRFTIMVNGRSMGARVVQRLFGPRLLRVLTKDWPPPGNPHLDLRTLNCIRLRAGQRMHTIFMM